MLVWIGLLIYVNANEKALIEKVSEVIHKRTRGEVKIGGLSVSFFRTFPILSLQLTDVVLKDSIRSFSNKGLLQVSDIYLRASIPGLIMHKMPISKVILSNGSINLLTDSLGNTNEYVLKSNSQQKSKGSFSMPDIVLKTMTINYENPKRFKAYNALIKTLKCFSRERDGKMIFRLDLGLFVNRLAFNTNKGGYLKGKYVKGNFELTVNTETKDIIADRIKIYIDGHPFQLDGRFNFDKNSSDFNLNIKTRKINYTNAVSCLTDSISVKMLKYFFTDPISFEVKLAGKTIFRNIPMVIARMAIKNNDVKTPAGLFNNCTFNAMFTNEMIKGKPRLDGNSIIHVSDFSGEWEKIKIKSRNIKISNLVFPYLDCDISSEADMKLLNNLTGSNTLQFLKGNASANLVFQAPLMNQDTTASNINGVIEFKDASIKYIPRNFLLSDCQATLKFFDNNLYVNKLSAVAGKTKLTMNGSVKNFLSLLNKSPEKLVLDWKITSPSLHLEDFKGFLAKPATGKPEKKDAQFRSASSKVDKMFSEGDVVINLDAPVMDYKTFRATDVKALVLLKATKISFENVSLNHAKGSMMVNGSLKNGDQYNPVSLNVSMQKMDIPLLFTAFENFGQDAITSKNLKGRLSADVNFNTAITNNAEIVTNASEGVINFLLEGGELNNFEPLKEISQKAFKKQDFSQIKFADLKNKLDVKGTTFIVNPMDIRSTALNFSVEGIYDFKKGTDMSIKLPLRNLTRSQADTDISDDAKSKKGVSLRLRAKTGDDGKLKVSWDPFRRAVKNKDEVKDSSNLKN